MSPRPVYVWDSVVFPEERRQWPSLDELAEEWWAQTRTEPEDIGAAWSFVKDQVGVGAGDSLEIIEALLLMAHGRDELLYVGAGPLEDLLSHDGHGEAFVDQVEERARASATWQTALSNVWLGKDVPEGVRRRLATLGARDFVAEHAMSEVELHHYFAERQRAGYDLPEDRG